ncbi:MAG: hypothetical protein IKP46_01095 [Bacteroidales bacterium]|nr:hypothetical protein [Bacteroidales bacterium]
MKKILVLAVALLLGGAAAHAEGDGTFSGYTPYSVYGVGLLNSEGCAFNASMGGVGIATRNKRFMNFLNPASVTARDTLSFMADFSVSGRFSYYGQGNLKSAHNTFNINDFALSFPIYRSSAMMIGIAPFSNVGYDFSTTTTDPVRLALQGASTERAKGNGGLYQVFAGAGVTFWKRLSIGAEYIFYFGKISRKVSIDYDEAAMLDQESGYTIQARAHGAKFGLQYEQPIGKRSSLILGATYRMQARMRGHLTDYSFASDGSSTDTLRFKEYLIHKDAKLFLGDEIGVGASYKYGDMLVFEFDYTRSNWKASGFSNTSTGVYNAFSNIIDENNVFSSGIAHSFRFGAEYTPGRNDIRYYYKRCTYRAGAYYTTSYYRFNDRPVNSWGITFGATLPIFKAYNGLTLGAEVGQSGTKKDGGIRETYFGLNLGFNIFDIWFQKPRYE